jgi:hypothetical protein
MINAASGGKLPMIADGPARHSRHVPARLVDHRMMVGHSGHYGAQIR